MRLLLAALLAVASAAPSMAAAPAQTDARFDALAAGVKAQMLADPTQAVQQGQQVLAYARSRRPGPERDLMEATANWLTGEALTRTGETSRAHPYVDAAATQAARIAPGSRLLADSLLLRGGQRAEEGDVARAMADLHAAHDLFRTLGESRGRARAFAMIANLYYDANDWSTALRYFGQALEVYHADPGLAVAIQNGQGLALTELKQWDAASRAFSQALVTARELKSPMLTATVLRNIARVRTATGQLSAAADAVEESMALARGLAPPEFVRRQLAMLGQVALQRHDLARAGRLVTQAFRGVDLSRTTLADREAHRTAYNTYRALGRSDLALAHLTAFKRLDDEATGLARSNGAALMAARFDFANQELRIANLKADDLRRSVELERGRARTQRIVLMTGVAATLAVIAVLAFALRAVRRSRDRVRAANVDLESTNSALGRALAAKTEFLATTSHEIRTPLNGILGMTQVMLADPRVEGATRDRVSVVHGAGVTMRALVDDILDVAKIETGKLTIEPQPFELCRALTESTRMWEEQARAKGLEFSVDLDDCPAGIVGDPGRLRQIVFNLLSNALKFTLSGSVALVARRRGNRYEIVVRDTGIGVAPERHEEIFESFRQADTTTTRRFGGTGLGLTICRSLARAMGGDVTLESEEGAGATFTLWLPLVEAETTTNPAVDAGQLGALVIDRNPITRAKLKALLESATAPVKGVADPAEAVLLLAQGSCRSIVVEDTALGAPEDAAAAIRRLAAAAADARIVVLRRTAGIDDWALLIAGANEVLKRPITRDALFASVHVESERWQPPEVVTQAA